VPALLFQRLSRDFGSIRSRVDQPGRETRVYLLSFDRMSIRGRQGRDRPLSEKNWGPIWLWVKKQLVTSSRGLFTLIRFRKNSGLRRRFVVGREEKKKDKSYFPPDGGKRRREKRTPAPLWRYNVQWRRRLFMGEIYVQYVAHRFSLPLSFGRKKWRAHSGEVTGTPSYNAVDKNIWERRERERERKKEEALRNITTVEIYAAVNKSAPYT